MNQNKVCSKKRYKNQCIQYKEYREEDDLVEGYWNVSKGPLLKATDRASKWIKWASRRTKWQWNGSTWWWNDSIRNSVNEKRKLWKKWKRENNKDKYLETRKMLGRLCIRSNVKQKKNICNEKGAEK